MPLIIGVIGPIASGKSLVCKTLVELGAAAYCDVDGLVHTMYDPGTVGFQRIVSLFGTEIVGRDGFIDRRKLGSKVFGKPDEMAKLNRAVGGVADEVTKVVNEWRSQLEPNQIAVLEHWSLGLRNQWCDVTWLVTSQVEVARRRLISRNKFSGKEADQRLAAQMGLRRKQPLVDLVIENNGTIEELKIRVKWEYQALQAGLN